jgi:hypothetical protein
VTEVVQWDISELIEKSQIANPKLQTNSNDQNSKYQTGLEILEIVI